jgi:hypothetical protein
LAAKPRPPLGEKSVRWLGVLVFLAGLVLSFGAPRAIDHYSKSRETSGTVFERDKAINSLVSISNIENKIDLEIWLSLFYLVGSYETRVATVSLKKRNSGDVIISQTILKKDLKKNSNPANIGKYLFELKGIKVDPGEYDLDAILLDQYRLNIGWIEYTAKPILSFRDADFSFFGNMALWLGAALFILGLRRRNRVDAAAPPAPSKWGRGS